MEWVQSIIATVLVVSVMLSVGLDVRWRSVANAFRRPGALARGLLFNHLAVPALALGVALLFGLSEPATLALVLCAALPGGPVGALMVQQSRGDLPLGVALLLSMAALNVIATPITLAVFDLEGGMGLVLRIGRVIATGVLLPLVVGLVVRDRYEPFAIRAQKVAKIVANVLLAGIIVGMVIVRWESVFGFQARTLAAFATVVTATLVGGWLVAGRSAPRQAALSMVSGVRNIAVALLLAPQVLEGEDQLLVPLYSLFMLIIVPLAMLAFRRRIPCDTPDSSAT